MEIIDAITVLMSYGLITKVSPSTVLASGAGGNANMLTNMLNNLGAFNMQNMSNNAGRGASNDIYSHNNNNNSNSSHHNHSHHQQHYHNGNQNGNNYHSHNSSHMQQHQNHSQHHHHHYQHSHHHNLNGAGVPNNNGNLGNAMHHFSSSKVKK